MLSHFLQIPSGYRGGSGYTASYDSTIGLGPGYYWFAASFLLFVVAGVIKAYYDDKKWDGKVMKMISKGMQIQDQYRIAIRGDRKGKKKTP